MAQSQNVLTTASLLLQLLLWVQQTVVYGYRVLNVTDPSQLNLYPPAVFVPYAPGFVGSFNDPSSTFERQHIDTGGPFSPDQPRLWDGVQPIMNCPNMVGPFEDSAYYCNGIEFGFCDRRTGTCWCNKGYQGLDCSQCIPQYYQVGSFCYPKQKCPNDCSNHGVCDYSTGTCQCKPLRQGTDCSQWSCSRYHAYCERCTATTCLACIEGYIYDGNSCTSCTMYDPRCLICSSIGCLECSDLLLSSIQRSGARYTDPSLPFDEMNRSYSTQFGFATQDARYFDEAEAYSVLPPSTNLSTSSMSCILGSSYDDNSWTCSPYRVSNVVCGSYGTVSIESPTYEILESAPFIYITILRTGGGMGSINVTFEVSHLNSTDADVSSTTLYTTSQRLTFQHNVVRLQFPISIYDNDLLEPSRRFLVTLTEVTLNNDANLRLVGGVVGNQNKAIVMILDDDSTRSNVLNALYDPLDYSQYQVAGTLSNFAIQTFTGSNASLSIGGDTYLCRVQLHHSIKIWGLFDYYNEDYEPDLQGTVVDAGNGNYTCQFMPLKTGNYTISMLKLVANGVRGTYYSGNNLYNDFYGNNAMDNAFTRIDRSINFTWYVDHFIGSTDLFQSVYFEGFLLAPSTDVFQFRAETNGGIRLYIEQFIIIDTWIEPDVSITGSFNFVEGKYYHITLEYRIPDDFSIRKQNVIQLLWSSTSSSTESIIPSQSFYYLSLPTSDSVLDTITVISNSTNSSTSTIDGTLQTIAGNVFQFEVIAKDAYSNLQFLIDEIDSDTLSSSVNEIFQSYIVCDNRIMDLHIQYDTSNNVLVASGKPLTSGSCLLNITTTIIDTPLFGSPFDLRIEPGLIAGTQSLASGPGIALNGVTAGTQTVVSVVSKDIYGNLMITGQQQFQLRAIHVASGLVDLSSILHDYSNGSYVLAYTPRRSGLYSVSIFINEMKIGQSPYSVTVVPNIAFGSNSVLTVVPFPSIVGIFSTFTIQAYDLNSNFITTGGSTIAITDANNSIINAACTDLNNGRYNCMYIPTSSGNLRLNIVINNMPIQNSPFKWHIMPGKIDGNHSIAFGSGLTSSIAGVNTTVFVQTKDSYANNEIANNGTLNTLSANLTDTLNHAFSCVVLYDTNGIYNVTYQLFRKGNYTLNIYANNQPVSNGPFQLYIHPAIVNASTTLSYITGPLNTSLYAGESISIQIEPRDSFYNLVETMYQFDLNRDITGIVTSAYYTETFVYSLILTPTQSRIYAFHPRVLIPGGLNGTYFSTPDFTNLPKYSTVDVGINFQFDTLPPKFTDSLNTFSIIWEGYVLPSFTEKYEFQVLVNGLFQLVIDNVVVGSTIQDGNDVTTTPTTANAATFVSSISASVSGTRGNNTFIEDSALHYYKHTFPTSLVGNKMTYIKLLYTNTMNRLNVSTKTTHFNVNRRSSIELYWTSLSQPLEIIPSSKLYTKWLTNPSTLSNFTTIPAASAPLFFYTMNRPEDITSNVWYTFTVQAMDGFNNSQFTGGDTVLLAFDSVSVTRPANITYNVDDFENGTYQVNVLAYTSGKFIMTIASTNTVNSMLKGSYEYTNYLKLYQIQNSPFVLSVKPNEAKYSTILNGMAIVSAGQVGSFKVQVFDILQNPLETGNDTIQIRFIATASNQILQVNYTVSDLQNGTYFVQYLPTIASLYEIDIAINNDLMVASSFTPLIVPSFASYRTSFTMNVPLTVSVGSRDILTYNVQLVDSYQNLLQGGGSNFLHFAMTGPNVVYGDGIDLQTGQFNVIVSNTKLVRGLYELQTLLVDPTTGNGLTGYYYSVPYFQSSKLMKKQLDPQMSFQNSMIMLYQSVKWKGYLQNLYTETITFTFEVYQESDINIILYLNDVVVLDYWNTKQNSTNMQFKRSGNGLKLQGSMNLVGLQVYHIRIEYQNAFQSKILTTTTTATTPTTGNVSNRMNNSFLKLFWQSDRTPYSEIPATVLSPIANEILPRYQIVVN